MKQINERNRKRAQRHRRVRKRVTGTAEQPRLTVFRSLRHISAHLVDDVLGRPIMGVSSLDDQVTASAKGEKGKVAVAKAVGLRLAEKARDKGIETVVFDRSGYLYHGRVKAVADGAREGGLKF